MTLVPDLGAARRFLDLFGEGLEHTFQVFPDCKDVPPDAWHKHGDLDDLSLRLSLSNNMRHGVYFSVNETDGVGRKNENIKCIRALFIDLDGAPLQPVLACGLDPHAIVCSSPGRYQVYWMVSHCPVNDFSGYQVALANKFDSDKGVKDPARVMRVPGFYHNKKDPFLVEIHTLDHFLPYKLETIIEALDLQPTFDAAQKEPLPSLGEMLDRKIPEGDRHNTLMRMASKLAYSGHDAEEVYAIIQGVNHVSCSSPKSVREVKSIVEAAMSYAGPSPDISGIVGGDGSSEDTSEYGDASDLALPECFVCGAPGLVGAIADWISVSTSRYQPHFAIAASLAFVGSLKGHRVQTQRKSRTNHMTLAIGKSGSGKSEVGNKIEDLARLAGLNAMMMGNPASDSALRGALSNRSGRAFLYWDEMGLALEGMLSRNAQFHFKAIKDLMIELWTKSNSTLRRKELITQTAQEAHKDVDQPCFGMYSNAQPDVFYGALSSAHAADGFYPRLLVFETTNNYPPERPHIHEDPPSNLIEACREIDQNWPTNVQPSGGNLDHLTIIPRTVAFSPGAQKLIDAARNDVFKNLVKTQESSISGIIARSVEHMEKIALTVEDGPIITRESMEWSVDLVTRLSASMAAAFKLRVSDSPIERTKKRVLQVIAATGTNGIASNALTRRTQFLRDKRERDVVLSELESSGLAHAVNETTGGRTVKRWVVTKPQK